jgi:hypothetical protein
MSARERLDRQMNALMALQVVVTIEALRALVAFEWSIVLRRLLRCLRRLAVHLVEVCSVTAVITMHHTVGEATDQHWLSIRVVDVGHDGSMGLERRKSTLVSVW